VTLSRDVTLDVAFDLPRSGTAYVVNTRRNTVTPVDLATDTATRAIRGFDVPRAIATAPDGGTAYVVDAGNGAVTPINLATNRTEPAITGFVHPGPIAVTPDGKTAYVLEDGGRLVPVDLVTDQSKLPIAFAKRSGVGRYARSLAIAPDGKTAYVGTSTPGTHAVSGTVAAVDLATGEVRAVLRGFADPAAIAVTTNGGVAYVADVTRGNVTPIKLATMRRIAAPALTARGAFPGADALAITPDGNTVYVATNHVLRGTASHGYGVGVISTATNTALFAGLTGIASPGGLAITPDGRTAYISGKGSVVPLDVATNTERPAVGGLGSPTAIAITVPPAPHYSAKLAAHPQVRGNGVSDAVTCSSSTTSCTTIQTLTVTETVSPRSVAVTARGDRHRSRRLVLVIGSRTLTVRPRHTVEMMIRFNAVGRQLMTRFGSLPVLLSLAIRRGGHTDTLTTSKLTIGASSRRLRR
jgi:DNA-binding beta-propeller fold protein YncE